MGLNAVQQSPAQTGRPPSYTRLGPRSTVYVLNDLDIDAALELDPDTDLLGPFTTANSGVEPLCIRKTIYLPTPFVGNFLYRDLTPTEAWNHICGAIGDAGQEVDFRSIGEWLWVALTKKVGDEKSPLALPRPTITLGDRNLLSHCHHMLTRHLPGLDPSPQRVQGSLIATHVGEVRVKLRRDWEAKLQARKSDYLKGVPDLLGINLTYLLHLSQVSENEPPPPPSIRSSWGPQSVST